MVDARPAAVIVLAAGAGTRMRSTTPKVLHEIAGRSLLGHVVHAASGLESRHLIVVVGHERERVSAHLNKVIAPQLAPAAAQVLGTVYQERQRGTGDAVAVALGDPSLRDLAVDGSGEDDTVLVLNGDTPLLRTQTLRNLLARHREQSASATVGTSIVPDAEGLGRILRDGAGELTGIVEQRDATPAQLAINEISTGVFAFNAAALRQMLPLLKPSNSQQQEYLTDVIGLLRKEAVRGRAVQAHRIGDYRQSLGCNDRAELAVLAALLRDRLATQWMRHGVTMIDPGTVWLDVTVQLSPDAVIAPNVQLYGATYVASGARIGPDTTLIDTRVGENTTILRSHAQSAQVGADCSVGPFAYLRPGAVLGVGVKVGAYVEVKNSQLADDVKVPHLSYIGDASVGEGSNIGAGSVVVNYDGVAKHRTTIGRHCRTGSNTLFIAPVTIGDGAYTAAGSVITSDVPPGALGFARAPQRNVDSWVFRRRAGSVAAQAAQRALPGQAPTATGTEYRGHAHDVDSGS
ncbi:MAG: bifunctional UDP-N-acetylglucosamine diphosphorylase/glucosamine-1-phosphate N-acetyltransferase GlmU [Mycobacteriales bacterium]